MGRPQLATSADQLPKVEAVLVSISVIEPKGLLRRPRAARVAAIASSMVEDGQIKPIEISPSRVVGGVQHYHLTKGWVRWEAAKQLGWSSLQAVVKRATATERRQREVDENLIENGCTALDRARYLFALKAVYEAQNPYASHGGARQGAGFQLAKFGDLKHDTAPFAAYAAARYGLARRNIERACTIGERLDPIAADLLADTDWADHQAALETLSRHEPAVQRKAVEALTRDVLPAATMADAIAMVLGAPAATDPVKKAWSAVLGGWGRLGAKDRREWLKTIATDLPTGVRIVFDGGEA